MHCRQRRGAELRAFAAEKLEACDSALQHSRRVGSYMPGFDKKGAKEQQLQKVCKDASKVALEQIKGISTQVGYRPRPSDAPSPMEIKRVAEDSEEISDLF